MITDPLQISAVVVLITAAAFWLNKNVKLLSKVGASLLVMILGALLSNLNVIPAKSPIYDFLDGKMLYLAIAWMLLSVNLSDLKRAGSKMIGAFALACIGTMAGVCAGSFIFADAFGSNIPRLAGALTGTYSGGSANFAAVGKMLELPEHLYLATMAADNLTTGIWLGVNLMLPIWLIRFYPARKEPGGTIEDINEHPFFTKSGVSVLNLAVLIATGLVIYVAAIQLGKLIPAIHKILWMTIIALAVGHTKPFARMEGASQLGNLGLHLFFAVMGIRSQISLIQEVGLEVFGLTLTVVLVHGLVIYVAGRLFRLDLGTIAVASQAAVGGPSSALAVAVTRQWKSLVVPGIIVGLLGYAVGNFLGYAVHKVIISIVGG